MEIQREKGRLGFLGFAPGREIEREKERPRVAERERGGRNDGKQFAEREREVDRDRGSYLEESRPDFERVDRRERWRKMNERATTTSERERGLLLVGWFCLAQERGIP